MDVIVFDKVPVSVRSYNQDGHLFVKETPISKANICEYYGHEIPKNEELRLDKDKVYRMYRHPEEMRKALKTFNNLPLLRGHADADAENLPKERIIGSLGEKAKFIAPYLKNSLVIWDGEAIDAIKREEERELSCGYRYDPDMTRGYVDGMPYDGIMRNIRGNHVALVPKGRVGSDVMVHDKEREKSMEEEQQRVAERAAEAILELYTDRDDVLAALEGAGLIDAAKRVLARIESGETVGDKVVHHTQADLFNGGESPNKIYIGKEGGHGRVGWNHDDDENEESPAEEFSKKLHPLKLRGKTTEEMRKIADKRGSAKEKLERFAQYLKEDGHKRGTIEKIMKVVKESKAFDEEDDEPEWIKTMKAGMMERGATEEQADECARMCLNMTPEDRGQDEEEDKGEKKAMDAYSIQRTVKDAVNVALARQKKDFLDLEEAKNEVRPLVGQIMGMDSAADVYSYALKKLGISHAGVNREGLRSMVHVMKQAKGMESSQRVATDSVRSTIPGIRPAPKKIML